MCGVTTDVHSMHSCRPNASSFGMCPCAGNKKYALAKWFVGMWLLGPWLQHLPLLQILTLKCYRYEGVPTNYISSGLDSPRFAIVLGCFDGGHGVGCNLKCWTGEISWMCSH